MPEQPRESAMKITITQLWVLAVAIIVTGILLDAFDGSPIEGRMKYIAGVCSCAIGSTIVGLLNKRKGLV